MSRQMILQGVVRFVFGWDSKYWMSWKNESMGLRLMIDSWGVLWM